MTVWPNTVERNSERERERERGKERERERERKREEVVEQSGRNGCVSTTKRKTPTLVHLSTEATRWSKRM